MIRLLDRIGFRFSTSQKTALHDWHVLNKGKIVDFAGYLLPVQFPEGVLKEHLHTRTKCSFFDVSHMGQINIKGPDVIKFIQTVTVGDVKSKLGGDVDKSIKNIYESYLSLILNKEAGIIDDTIINYNAEKKQINMVVNGANKHIVMDHFNEVKKTTNFNVDILLDDTKSLISVQGPEAYIAIEDIFKGLKTEGVPFMSQFQYRDPQYKKEIGIMRTSYAGTDGFEISLDNGEAVKFADSLLKVPNVKPAGLGARDSLRLEAGLCLHGHDINNKTTPFEASLMWTVRKNKEGREKFIGQQVLEEQVSKNKEKKNRVQKRVGFMVTEGGIVREGAPVLNSKKQKIGHVTSGTYSPILKKGIGMLYVDQGYTKVDTDIILISRDKEVQAKISKMPFVPAGYNRLWDKI